MLAALKTSLAVKVAAAIGASTAIGATAIAGPDALPFVDGDAAGIVEADTGQDGGLFDTRPAGEENAHMDDDSLVGGDASADAELNVDLG